MTWFVYILQCADNTLYTGVTTDIDKRIQTHTLGKGAKYTKGKAPFKLVYLEEFPDRSTAQKREYAVKQLTKVQKSTLIKTSAKY